MGLLSASIRLYGTIVEDRVLPVLDSVRLGEADEAEVAFPGADILVQRVGDRYLVRGHWLEIGERFEMSLGAVDVTLEHVVPSRLPRTPIVVPDFRVLVATAAIVLAGTAWEVASAVVRQTPAVAEVARQVVPGAQEAQSARLHGPEEEDLRSAGEESYLPAHDPLDTTRWPPTTFLDQSPTTPAGTPAAE